MPHRPGLRISSLKAAQVAREVATAAREAEMEKEV